MATTHTYTPRALKVTLAGVQLDAFAPGSGFLRLEPNAPASTYVAGVDGSITRIKGIDASWTCTIVMQQEHAQVQVMHALQALTRNLANATSSLDVFPMVISREDTGAEWLTSAAYIQDFAVEAFGTTDADQVREYTFIWQDITYVFPTRVNTPLIGSIPSLKI